MAGTPYTYSFQNVLAAINGPGGGFPLGQGAGAAEEGISIVYNDETNNMQIGADGSGVHSLSMNKSGTITVRLLKNSPVNALLSEMYNLQRANAANHGQNTISVALKNAGDTITAQQVAFKKVPDLNYPKNAPVVEWTFDAVTIDFAFGAGNLT